MSPPVGMFHTIWHAVLGPFMGIIWTRRTPVQIFRMCYRAMRSGVRCSSGHRRQPASFNAWFSEIAIQSGHALAAKVSLFLFLCRLPAKAAFLRQPDIQISCNACSMFSKILSGYRCSIGHYEHGTSQLLSCNLSYA